MFGLLRVILKRGKNGFWKGGGGVGGGMDIWFRVVFKTPY